MGKPVRSSLQNLSIAYECALAIGNSLNLSEMLREVIHTMVHKTNAHRGIIWVKNGEKKLQPVASAGIDIEDVLAQGEIKDLRDVLNQIQKSRQFVLKNKDDKDFLQYCPVLTEKEESVLIVPVTNVAILHLVYASREIADEPLANLLAGLSKKLSVAIEACTAHVNIIKEIQVREKAEKELTKKTEQLISREKELQGLYGESERARKSLLSILEDVARKEKALKESESKLNSILSSIDDLVFVFDQEDRFTLAQNPTSKQLYTTPDEFIGKKPFEVMPSHLNKIFLDAFDKIRKGDVAEYDYWLKIEGKTLWFSAKHSPRFIDGELMGSVAVVRDITERKAAEEELKETTKLLQSIMDNAADEVIIATDQMGIILNWNEGARRLLGYEPEEVVGKESVRIFHTEEYLKSGIMDVNIKKMIATGKPLTEELNYVTKDGRTIPVQQIVNLRFGEDGELIGMVGMARDITERKRADEALRESEEKFRVLAENSIDCIWLLDTKLRFTYLSPSAERIMGFKPEQWVGTKISSHFKKKEFLKVGVLAAKAIKDYKTFTHVTFETKMLNSKNDEVDVEISSKALLNSQGKLIGLQGTTRDITERKAAEKAISESEEKIRMITASANDAIIMMDHEGNISYWNKAAERMFDYMEEEVLGKDLHALLVPERFHAAFSKGFERSKKTGQGNALGKTVELAAFGKDGIEFPVELSLSAVKLKGRWNAVGLLRDTTERKAVEAEIKEKADELEKFNRLAVGRELKMIELKKEINVLLEELGKGPGYKIVGES